MNPFSQPHYKDDSESFSEHNKLNSVIFKCGAPETTLFPGTSINSTTSTATVASVNLDTSCFCNSCIRFEFANNIIIPATTANATLTFQIFKNCGNHVQPIPVGSQWTFLTSAATSDMFSFFVCDCNSCSNECCTYTVQVIATVLAIGETPDATTTVTINAATLSAFAVDNVNEHC